MYSCACYFGIGCIAFAYSVSPAQIFKRRNVKRQYNADKQDCKLSQLIGQPVILPGAGSNLEQSV